MPIVSHTNQQITRADGSSYNVVRLLDQDGREYMMSFAAPAGFDVAARIAAMYADMDERLKESEFETLISADN